MFVTNLLIMNLCTSKRTAGVGVEQFLKGLLVSVEGLEEQVRYFSSFLIQVQKRLGVSA